MRKRKKGRKLSLKKGPRRQLLKLLVNNFFSYGKITTSEAKAKEMRKIVERLITSAKEDSVFNRRLVARVLNPAMVKKLFEEIAPLYKNRNGGYTRIIKLGRRESDGAKMVIIELVK